MNGLKVYKEMMYTKKCIKELLLKVKCTFIKK